MAAAAATVSIAMGGGCTEAYVSSTSLRRSSLKRSSAGKAGFSPAAIKVGDGVRRKREDGSAVTLYLSPAENPPSRRRGQRPRREPVGSALPAMSASVLLESDTLPSFRTAHGLLSPEVVARIAEESELTLVDGPVHRFLKTYRSRGPMACLPMLSDPSVLPELTRAMRQIA